MALGTLKIIEEAVHDLLANPTTPIVGDANREEARALFQLLDLPVYVGSRPQASAEMSISIRRTAGPVHTAVDRPLVGAQTAIDVLLWGRGDNRDHLPDMMDAGQLIRVYLVGMSRTVKGVDISDCQVDGSEAIQADIPPNDTSDSWLTRISWTYLFTHDQTVASAVAV